jgi:hypothetical protein
VFPALCGFDFLTYVVADNPHSGAYQRERSAIMPKLSNRPPKPSKHKSGKNEYAVVYVNGKKNNLGRWGSPEAREAYARFEVEWWENSRHPVAERVSRTLPGSGEKTIVKEIALAFLQYAEATKTESNFIDYRIATMDFLVKHYGSLPADEFTAGCLNLTREAIIQSRRFCRMGINDYTRRIVTLFRWGVSVVANSLVNGFCLEPSVAANITWEHYNPKCSPPWTDAERHDFDRKFTEVRNLPQDKPRGWLLQQSPYR